MQKRLVVLIALVALLGGCQWIKRKLGIGTEVVDPDKESPEWVVQQVLKAAAIEDESAAFEEYKKYLHSSEVCDKWQDDKCVRANESSLKMWREFRFRALRRKYKIYLRDDEGKFSYKHMYTEEDEKYDYIKVFVLPKTSDMPTPCHLYPDKKRGGKWRIKMNCLN